MTNAETVPSWFKSGPSYVKHTIYQIVPQTWGKIFLYSHLSFTAAYSLKSEKHWPVDFAKL